jgi:hypothetical protein
MDARHINQTTEIIPLLGYELKKAGGYHVGACPFCGGKDRFTVKRTTQGDRCHCRQCWDGKYHTVIDYIMRRDNCDFKTAVKTLGGDVQKNITPRMVMPIPPKPIQIPADDWQGEAWREVDTASDALCQSQGKAARDFLTSRKIPFAMWQAWHLGFMFYSPKDKPHVRIPVLTIPWYDMDANSEAITAVKYRVLNPESKLRYFSKAGSRFDIPFGLWDALPGFHHSLLLIEGELNCISVSQCRPAGVSVLSFGSEGGGDIRALKAIAKRYPNVYVWADDVWDNPNQKQHARELHALIRGKGKPLRSVKQDEVKQDANQLLQVGALAGFLSRVLNVECQ